MPKKKCEGEFGDLCPAGDELEKLAEETYEKSRNSLSGKRGAIAVLESQLRKAYDQGKGEEIEFARKSSIWQTNCNCKSCIEFRKHIKEFDKKVSKE